MNTGRVYNYNGIVGKIVTSDKVYLFSYIGVMEPIKNGQIVTFTVRDNDYKIVTDIRPQKSDDLGSIMRRLRNNN